MTGSVQKPVDDGHTTRPRVLLTLADTPFSADSGKRIRSRLILDALTSIADVDVVLFSSTSDDSAPPPPHAGVQSFTRVRLRRRSRASSGLRMIATARPFGVASPDWEELRHVLAGRDVAYDVVWYGGMHHADRLAQHVNSRHSIVDVDDVESVKARRLLSTSEATGSFASRAWIRLDARLWQRVEHRLASTTDRIVVCSAVDRMVLQEPNAVIVPNAYPEPSEARGPGSEPLLVLVGNFEYQPNVDAAEFAGRDIMPLIRSEIPDSRLLLIGRGENHIAHLAVLDGVDVIGAVDDVADLLAAARVVVVPIRVGGGTRIKLIEAMAHGLPSVSTTVGAEGLDVNDGEQVLIRDRADDFADACVSLLRSADQARAIGARARERYLDSYLPEVPKQAVTDLVNELMRQDAQTRERAG